MNELERNLTLVAVLMAVFAWVVRRGALSAKETLWLGSALGFFVASVVFNTVLRATRPVFGGAALKLVGISFAMTLPIVLAVVWGVWTLYKSLVERELAVVQMDGLTLRLLSGNIADLKRAGPFDAIVHPTDTRLTMGGSVGGALKSFGGRGMEQEAKARGPVAVGQAVTTGAGKLAVRQIIHVAATEARGKTDADTLRRSLDASLKAAKKVGARRVALPAFSPGVNRIPNAEIAALTVAAILRVRRDFDEIAVVVFDRRAAPAFVSEWAKLAAAHASASP